MCTRCKVNKPVESSASETVSRDGLDSICKACRKSSNKEAYRRRVSTRPVKLLNKMRPADVMVTWRCQPVGRSPNVNALPPHVAPANGEMCAVDMRGGPEGSEGIADLINARTTQTDESPLLTVQSDRAMVTDIPGITLDVVEAAVSVGGIPLYLLNTVCIRSTSDRRGALQGRRCGRCRGRKGGVRTAGRHVCSGRSRSGERALLNIVGAGVAAAEGISRAVKQRQAEQLVRASEALQRLVASIDDDLPVDFGKVDVREAALALRKSSGDDVTEKVLDGRFRRKVTSREVFYRVRNIKKMVQTPYDRNQHSRELKVPGGIVYA
ncbi:hypothetical protein KFL_001610040 [Klebsormidium nitens]|uniref:Uncharacterized protein n=1 Tax=Klebsormidium nitens TaxID=105231 RepID=A0A1Y1I002_KLENI|nr:hypothetical protein KFL_001610040 [Klebsormidium nitens]|eukprot:GAQ83763.1 hypothetical protein KFL_001610040 [Klebsormidium nitens]